VKRRRIPSTSAKLTLGNQTEEDSPATAYHNRIAHARHFAPSCN
jgi:hypothetical protein